jgi:hypothetical protein
MECDTERHTSIPWSSRLRERRSRLVHIRNERGLTGQHIKLLARGKMRHWKEDRKDIRRAGSHVVEEEGDAKRQGKEEKGPDLGVLDLDLLLEADEDGVVGEVLVELDNVDFDVFHF